MGQARGTLKQGREYEDSRTTSRDPMLNARPFNCHPERSEGSNVLAFLGVLLSKHFRFLAALE